MSTVEVSKLLKVDSGLSVEQVQKFFTATPKDKVQTRPAKGGGTWDYVAGSYVTQVLNSLFGFNWSFEVVTSMQEALATANTGTVVVQGRLKVKIGDEWITKEQYGRKDVAYRKGSTTDLLDFGNDLKAAATDAKKKCASELGLFADVYSKEDFFEVKVVDDTEEYSFEETSAQFKQVSTIEEVNNLLSSLPADKQLAFTQVAKHRVQEIRDGDKSRSENA